jgi:hypothetical protein
MQPLVADAVPAKTPMCALVGTSRLQEVRGDFGTPPSTRRLWDVSVILIGPLCATALALIQMKGGWDDGAIAAAFARTYAEVGRFAVTPRSVEVEGFSSLSWVFLLALPRYFSQRPDVIVIWMKCLSGFCFVLSLLVFRRIANRFLENGQAALLATFILAFNSAPLHEVVNGMEMNLAMLLLLCLVDRLTDGNKRDVNWAFVWLSASLLLFTRFEAPYFIAFTLLGCKRHLGTRRVFQLGAAVAFAFGAIEIWRFMRFGLFMPNTVYAKMHEPYQLGYDLASLLLTRALATSELVVVLFGPLVVLVTAALLTRLSLRDLVIGCAGKLDPLIVSLTAAGVLFGILLGANWGPWGRMIQPVIPFMILLIVFLLRLVPLSRRRRTILFAAAGAVQLLAWLQVSARLIRYGDDVPLWVVEGDGLSAERVRQLTGRATLSFLTPNLGGSALYYERLDILDLALLANPYLARPGYKAFDGFLRQSRPQVIETCGLFSRVSGIYDSDLMKDYSVVVIGRRLLVRDDVFRELNSMPGVQHVSGTPCLGPAWLAYPIDEAFVQRKRSCLYFND